MPKPSKFPLPQSQRTMMALNRARGRAKKSTFVESPLKPNLRPSSDPKKTYTDRTSNQKDPQGKGSGFFPGIRQGNTMWVMPKKDPKTGKVRKGYLAWRNDYERAYIKDEKTGKDRRVRRGDRVTGSVRIEKPGTTYVDKTAASTRGGSSYDNQQQKPTNLARYVAGRNVNSPSMKKKLAQNFVSAAKRERSKKNK